MDSKLGGDKLRYWLSLIWIWSIILHCVSAMPCLDQCQCSLHGINFFVDCSGLELSELPEIDDAMEINWLDLSNNLFTDIPPGLARFGSLESLDLSGNRISHLSANVLEGFNSLKTLSLSKNNITNWLDINPNEILQHAPMISALHLNENPLTSFSSSDEKLVLISNSLRILDIKDCKISKINGNAMIEGLPKLEHLDLSGNPIRSITSIISNSLIGLNLSSCRLATIPSDALVNLPSLTHINFARNHRIDLITKPGEFVHSESLQRIDLSFCNMDSIELSGFPVLKVAILRGNMIKEVTKETFALNEHLQILDLSSNSITQISGNALKGLTQLKTLDLSFNTIQRIERDTFKDNGELTSINLSRNFISRFTRLSSNSVSSLNLSSCDIMSIDSDSLIGMPSLTEIDLSHNLISSFPDGLVSDSLQSLDLRTCRISAIRNSTFMNLPELTSLRLSGNRLTTTFRIDFFDRNPYLSEIWLGDNPWRCDCRNNEFQSFYRFLIEHPPRVHDRNQLRCGSPEEFYGFHWEVACFNIWHPNQTPMGTAEKVWTIVLVGIFVFAGSLCLIMTIKRCIEGRKLTRNERERQLFLEEQRDVMRQNRMAMEQQAQLNAPDPRETRPPCYEDALLLPRLDGSFASLNELGLKREKRRENVTSSRIIETENVEISRRSRCRSEEQLSMRDSQAGDRRSRRYRAPSQTNPTFDNPQYANISIARRHTRLRIPTSPPPTRVPTPPPIEDLPLPPPPPRPPVARPPAPKPDEELHYHSTEILNLPDNYPSVPSSKKSSPPLSGEFDNLEDFSTSKESPYARRKSRSLATESQENSNSNPNQTDEIVVIEDHFGKSPSVFPVNPIQQISSSSSDSSKISIDEETYATIENTREKSSSPEIIDVQTNVQVHYHPKESSL